MNKFLGFALFIASGSAMAADSNLGRMLAETRGCIGCHGMNGISNQPVVPNLAGQRADYIRKALKDFRSGRRSDPNMNAMVGTLNDAEIEDLAAHFSSLR